MCLLLLWQPKAIVVSAVSTFRVAAGDEQAEERQLSLHICSEFGLAVHMDQSCTEPKFLHRMNMSIANRVALCSKENLRSSIPVNSRNCSVGSKSAVEP
jgi:hypothetical protein